MDEKFDENKKVKILYVNWRGETSIREIIPIKLVFVSTEWHPEKQWCLEAYDLDKKDDRTFACKDIKAWFIK